MKLADQSAEPPQLTKRQRTQLVGHLAWDVLEDLAALLIAAECSRSTRKANGLEMLE
jgi:hypothetical protein